MIRKAPWAVLALTFGMSIASANENPPAHPVSLSATDIADKNVAARGGLSAWRAVQALSMRGKMDAGGNERSTLATPGPRDGQQGPPPRPKEQAQLPFVIEFKRPRKMRVELEFEGKTAVQVFDGSNGWKLRPFLGREQVEPYTADELKSALTQSELDGPLVDYAAKGTKVELAATEKVDGRDAYKLRLTMKSGEVRHVWIDAQTFLDVKIEGQPRRMDGKMRPVEIYMKDYRTVGGVMIPYELDTAVIGFQPAHKMIVENVVVNPPLSDGLFAKPAVVKK